MLNQIEILLALYNGEEHIKQQIDSILSQTIQCDRLFLRDDSSHDSTLQIVQAYQKEINIITLLDSQVRLGINQNFTQLLKFSQSEYTLFCDQDDIWIPNKVELVLNKMKELEMQYGKDMPLLVHSDLKVVDENLNLLSDSFWRYQNLDPNSANNLSRLLIQNVVTGCTMMINKPLRQLVNNIPSKAIMYDWWIALVANVFGKIDYVSHSTVLYRQHSTNDTGARKWGISYILKRINNIETIKSYYIQTMIQARCFLEIYEDKLDFDKYQIIFNYAYIDQKHFWQRRLDLIKYGYYQFGSLRNLGLFIIA